jgi:hypothetical protein
LSKASVIALFVLTVATIAARFIARLRLSWGRGQRFRFRADDGFLLFGLACAVVATVLLLRLIDQLYLIKALMFRLPGLVVPVDIAAQAEHYHRYVSASLMLLWTAVCSAKFSFLCFIHQIIRGQEGRLKAWWLVVTVFCGVVSLYGGSTYIMTCPWFDFARSSKCSLLSVAFQVLTTFPCVPALLPFVYLVGRRNLPPTSFPF